MLKVVFEQYGAVEDVVTFPGRMYAFVNFRNAEEAARAREALDGKEVRAYLTRMKLSPPLFQALSRVCCIALAMTARAPSKTCSCAAGLSRCGLGMACEALGSWGICRW